MSPTLTMAQAAEAIGMAARTFRRERHRLMRERGFPLPCTVMRTPRWDAEAVREWRLRQSHPGAHPTIAPMRRLNAPPAADEGAAARARFQKERLGIA